MRIRNVEPAPTRCVCGRPTALGTDLCKSCLDTLRCARCGHALHAHDEGPCAVNQHEDATGPECECESWVPSLGFVVEQQALKLMRQLSDEELETLRKLFPEDADV